MAKATNTAAPLASSSGTSKNAGQSAPKSDVREDPLMNGAGEPETQASDNQDARAEKIRNAAYAAYERRGGAHGHEVEDWIQAEAEVDREAATRNPPARSI